MLPNFGAMQSHNLRNAAEQIVERVDFGRQRAVMTGIPHQLAIDLDAGTYALEWLGESARDVEPEPTPDAETGIETRLSLEPPPEPKRNFESVPGPIGRRAVLGKGIEFAWLETPGGDVDFGEAFITFEADGTSSYTLVVLDEPGGREIALEILPLADTVRILDEEF
jgi:uncharacterized protein YndB with AHSA1/START domain